MLLSVGTRVKVIAGNSGDSRRYANRVGKISTIGYNDGKQYYMLVLDPTNPEDSKHAFLITIGVWSDEVGRFKDNNFITRQARNTPE